MINRTYPVPQLSQCTLQVMSYRVEIPETNTHRHTHTPARKLRYFIDGYLVAKTQITKLFKIIHSENIFLLIRLNKNDNPIEQKTSK